MKTKTVYQNFELKRGKCSSCGERSNEILIGDGRCVDCIEEQKFFEETMKNAPKQANHKSPFGMW